MLHTELHDDLATHTAAKGRPWRPIPVGPGSPFAVSDPPDGAAPFSVIELADDELAGEATLWGIDLHNRAAHIGLSLRPAWRGRGLGSDVVGVLCNYGFVNLGLQRLQIETLADNVAMQRAAAKSGFVHEGLFRRSAWIDGEFADEVVLGLLATEWQRG